MKPARLLIVDPTNEAACLAEALGDYDIATEPAADAALARLEGEPFAVAIVDHELGSCDGLAFMTEAQRIRPELAVILITGFGTIESAVAAMREGAFDYLSKPVMSEELCLAVQRAIQQTKLVAENRTLKRALDRRKQLGNIIGTNDQMARIFEVVESVSPTRASVLITGESGTGKTMLARKIHELSSRAEGPFVEVNCGALPDTLLESELFGHAKGAFTGAIKDKQGKFEGADRGTIFLDEIATASTALQVKLLRVIQDRLLERVGETQTRKVDVRIVLATNSDLLQLVEEGTFREDLYYRINVVTIEIPPLRARQEDIPYLLDHFLKTYTEYHDKRVEGFAPRALDYLLSHGWPGNIRELENAVERAVVLAKGPFVEVTDLPPTLTRREQPLVELRQEALPLKKALEEPERLIIQRALELNGWNRQKTADMLEVNRTTLFHKMKKYQLCDRGGKDA